MISSTHKSPAVVDLCPRSLVLNGGECVFDGPSSEATARYMQLLRGDEARSSNGRCEMLGWRFEPTGDAALRPGDSFTLEFRLRFRRAAQSPTFNFIVHRFPHPLPVYH